MPTVESRPITSAEFFEMPDLGPCELVRGRIVPMNQPGWRHGRIGMRIGFLVETYLQTHDLGRISGLDTGVVTERDPDTVRGADVCYVSYARLPADQDPEDYPEVAPEIIWEVRSPSDRQAKVLTKVSEYLNAGVLAVCVVDPRRRSLTTYHPDSPEETIGIEGLWREPDILPGFEMSAADVFRQHRGG
jgi:Uma2 family endonuclease